ncbi:MAG: diaminopimelate decarboxylase [Candidatus Marinimicrobia bacterium]|jgi:diaminopimelate decarboxylase|nr:diaminopimelate decarboxylase [Candidatus Neomarinimicrobiota bacterium]MBT3630403.1 diaminopimelate decarboxylase [Candidatus Neomarinimicrobiota bacterium]MBT3823722.1 diaminopimelate decarboxylase [Candidatus Neomarinimicrobiota bacterium]MBT4131929.1 diaminopimelate decarboxylase [Candidatus Neomarinimicrobiota bacterium]MBT4294655.1 diaminopimelate decarboxylase [Candidatus Neomarinimicrobiota bacterium]
MAFNYINQRLHCDGVDLQDVAEKYGTPAYIYSEQILRHNAEVLKKTFIDRGFKVSYAMKANSNPTILNLFRNYGLGLDIVSEGEFKMAKYCGFEGSEINFAGVGKTVEELDLALAFDIDHFNVESRFELELLEKRAGIAGKKAVVLLRLNPDIDPLTHPHISTGLKQNKFGMSPEKVRYFLTHPESFPHIQFDGIHCHIGSQILQPQPFYDLIDYLQKFTKSLRGEGVKFNNLDLGGGFGVNYEDPLEDISTTTPFLESIAERAIEKLGDYQLHIQPGRVLVANSGVLLARVLGNKENGGHRFIIIDGATTDLIRPAMYDAYHAIYSHIEDHTTKIYDVVGPVCESSDALARNRNIPEFDTGDLMLIGSAGAYASSMGSTYNMRPLSPEIMVDGSGETRLIRKRQSFDEMISLYT